MDYWNRFESSGNLNAYLQYRDQKKREQRKVETSEKSKELK